MTLGCVTALKNRDDEALPTGIELSSSLITSFIPPSLIAEKQIREVMIRWTSNQLK